MSTKASSVLLSEKLFARKRLEPVETPISAIVEKTMTRESIIEVMPIISGVTTLEIKIHKMYAENRAIKFSL